MKRLLCGIKPTKLHLGHLLSIFYFLQFNKYKALGFKREDVFILLGDLHKISTSCNVDYNYFEAKNISKILSYMQLKYYIQSDMCIEYHKSFLLFQSLIDINYTHKVYNINYNNSTKNNCAKFLYPILMLNDIFLMQPCTVLVSKDQEHNIRFIKRALKQININHNIDFYILDDKILDLHCGTKMSTSVFSSGNIFLCDSHDQIKRVIMSAKTQQYMPKIVDDLEVCTYNLYNIYAKINHMTLEQVVFLFKDKNFVFFKEKLYDSILLFFDLFKQDSNDNIKIFNCINNVNQICINNYILLKNSLK